MYRRFLLLIFILIFPLSCGGGASENQTTPLPTIPVKTTKAVTGTIDQEREFAGGLQGIRQADVVVRLSEAVQSLPHRIGDRVRSGDVLVALNKGGASSQFFQARATYENAEKNFKKMKYLFDEKAISESQFDEASSGYEVAQANFQAAREMVDITSPISGTLVELNAVVGEVPPAGRVIARVAQIDSLRMTFGVSSDLIGRFQIGTEGTVEIPEYDTMLVCTVIRVASAADPQTRSFTVEVSIPNLEHQLRPGAFAKARFIIARSENATVVPEGSLISEEGVYSLYIVQNDTAYVRSVEVGVKNETSAQIISGVESGAEVVYIGQGFLSDGYPIVRSEK